eukprot:Colp12_sorted_trinity150504_noHs@29204
MANRNFVVLKFCKECDNMLYPSEDRENRVLEYSCKGCGLREEAESSCVYINRIRQNPTEMTQVITDVGSDPTLPRTDNVVCERCNHSKAVFFQSNARRGDQSMRLYYVCINCNHRWTSEVN